MATYKPALGYTITLLMSIALKVRSPIFIKLSALSSKKFVHCGSQLITYYKHTNVKIPFSVYCG
jgi:hypothetical protein